MVTQTTISPLEVHHVAETQPYWDYQYGITMHDATAFGSGDLTDDDDSSGYTLSAYYETLPNTFHGSAISGRFQAANCVAFLLQVKAKVNDAWLAVWSPGPIFRSFEITFDWRDGLTDDATTSHLSDGSDTTKGDGVLDDPDHSEFARLDSTFKWLTTSYGYAETQIDMTDPSDTGLWVETDLYPGMADALAAGTFWMSIAVDRNVSSWNDGTPTTLIDIAEMRLIVATTGVALSPPRRKYPRDDRYGVGPGRHYPPSTSQQASNRRAGGYV